MSDSRSMIEEVLGTPLNDAAEHSITSLYEITPALVEAAGRLSPVLRQIFLRFHVASSEHDFLPLFVEEVIEGGANPATWRKGRFLIPFPPIEEMVARDIAALFALVEGNAVSDDWKRMAISPDAWRAGDTTSGAPGVLRHDLDYRYSPPPHVLDFLIDRPLALEDVGELSVGVRRWIAACIARHLIRLGLEPSGEALELLAAAFPGVQASDDAVIAVRALIREASQCGEEGIPGFRGADDWYREPS